MKKKQTKVVGACVMTQHEDRPPQQDIQLATIASVGHARSWPRFDFSLMENVKEAAGGHIQVAGATREEAVSWLRHAANAIEAGKMLRVGFFE